MDTVNNILGKGSYGIVYEHGPYALKVTRAVDEYNAALALIHHPRPWSCKVYSAEQKAENEYHIVRERITPFLSGEYQNKFPGHFHGIICQQGEYKGLATRPVETNGFAFDYNDNKPLQVVKFNERQLQFLAALYNNNKTQQNCFTWFMKVFWEIKNDGFFTVDLWNNIGVRDDGGFVIFDLMMCSGGDANSL